MSNRSKIAGIILLLVVGIAYGAALGAVGIGRQPLNQCYTTRAAGEEIRRIRTEFETTVLNPLKDDFSAISLPLGFQHLGVLMQLAPRVIGLVPLPCWRKLAHSEKWARHIP